MVKTKQFYKNIGKKGEQAKVAKGFAWMDRARSREANRRRWAAVRANPGPRLIAVYRSDAPAESLLLLQRFSRSVLNFGADE
jgi:hypothetical protein